jgi:glycyl-tRNA synthetase
MRERLTRVTFTDKLGSMADRATRIAALATELAGPLGLGTATLDRAAQLVKVDLGSQLVTEMTSLAGVMARDYALGAGETRGVAEAIYEAELPRHTGDDLPATVPGALLSVADRLDLVTGLAATVGLPTGSSDPFAVRRAVLGLLAVHRAHPSLSELSLVDGLAAAAGHQPVPVSEDVLLSAREFLAKRLEQVLVEEGNPVDHVRAVLPHHARPSVADTLLRQLSSLGGDDDFRRVVEAIQRCRRIVPPDTPDAYDPALLTESAEIRLHEAVSAAADELAGSPEPDLVGFTTVMSRLAVPLADFFTDVFVMDEDPALRAARLGLLATVRDLGAGLLDWSQLHL